MIRQVDWAWIALGAVEAQRERPRPAAPPTDRVDRIKPVATTDGPRRATLKLKTPLPVAASAAARP